MQKCPKCGVELEIKLAADKPRSPSGGDHLDLERLLDTINDDDLEGAAAKFVSETRERFEKYGKNTRMSEKQMAWLERIAKGETGKEW